METKISKENKHCKSNPVVIHSSDSTGTAKLFYFHEKPDNYKGTSVVTFFYMYPRKEICCKSR